MKQGVIIFTDGGGRLANQLTNYGHLYAFYKHHNQQIALINIPFAPYSHLFDGSVDNRAGFLPQNHCYFPFLKFLLNNTGTFIHQRLIRVLHFLGYLLPHWQSVISPNKKAVKKRIIGKSVNYLSLDDATKTQILRAKPVTILAGWPLRCWELFAKYQEQIRAHFTVVATYKKPSDVYIQNLRKKHQKLIGVFIRKTDYKIWHNGKYFFSNQQYCEWMKQIQKIYANENIGFVIASDEPQSIADYKNIPVFFSSGIMGGDGHFVQSLYELSRCDWIISPPSTFSIWAAFLGDIPVLPLYQKKQIIALHDLLNNHIFACISHPHMSLAMK